MCLEKNWKVGEKWQKSDARKTILTETILWKELTLLHYIAYILDFNITSLKFDIAI